MSNHVKTGLARDERALCITARPVYSGVTMQEVSMSVYDLDLDKNAANFQPLTPLSFLQRSAAVYPDQLAIIHGSARVTYAQFYGRCRQLGSALAKAGIGKGDTVSVLLANTPAMLECHYGVPMAGGVLNTLNTRLDAATIAFSLSHA
jgi:fatty-acyl-CoA synthase